VCVTSRAACIGKPGVESVIVMLAGKTLVQQPRVIVAINTRPCCSCALVRRPGQCVSQRDAAPLLRTRIQEARPQIGLFSSCSRITWPTFWLQEAFAAVAELLKRSTCRSCATPVLTR